MFETVLAMNKITPNPPPPQKKKFPKNLFNGVGLTTLSFKEKLF